MFCCAVLCLFYFCNNLGGEESAGCFACRPVVTVIVLWLFLNVLRVVLQYLNVMFPDHTHLLF